MSSSQFSIVDQRAIISANLHSTLLLLFFIGVYMGVYPASVYIYLKSHQASTTNKYIIIGTLTAMYAVLMIQLGIQWDYLVIVLVTNGSSRLSIFYASVFNESGLGASFPVSLSVLQLVLQNLGFLLADGLMLWRCFNVCGRSALKSALPVTLFVIEFVFAIADTAFLGVYDVDVGFEIPKRARQANILSATLFCSGAATSLVTTFIICFQIYSSTAQNPRSRHRYKHIVDAITQSCAFYTIFILLLTISDFLSTGDAISSITSLILVNYLIIPAMAASALAPTLMVARLSIAGEERVEAFTYTSSSAVLPSDLEGRPNDEMVESTDITSETEL